MNTNNYIDLINLRLGFESDGDKLGRIRGCYLDFGSRGIFEEVCD